MHGRFTPCGVSLWVMVKRRAGGAVGFGGANIIIVNMAWDSVSISTLTNRPTTCTACHYTYDNKSDKQNKKCIACIVAYEMRRCVSVVQTLPQSHIRQHKPARRIWIRTLWRYTHMFITTHIETQLESQESPITRHNPRSMTGWAQWASLQETVKRWIEM